MHARNVLAVCMALTLVACRRGSEKTSDADAFAPTSSSTIATNVEAADGGALAVSDAGLSRDGKRFYIDVVGVSSRVDNDSEAPEGLIDGSLDRAWSSATGDLEGAWVAFAITGPTFNVMRAVHLTVGMTKDPALFAQNPRVAEVAISWTPYATQPPNRRKVGVEKILVPSAVLDTESRKLQRVPVDIHGVGELKILVKKVKAGSRPDWREVSISEVAFEDDEGHLMPTTSLEYSVGGMNQEPRGKLGVAPEAAMPLKCLAVDPLPSGPRAYCVVGRRLGPAVLVSIDKSGAKKLADLPPGPLDITEHRLAWPAWRRVEKELSADTRTILDADKYEVGWRSENQLANGALFRTKETKRGPLPGGDAGVVVNGIVELQFPGSETFVPVLPELVEDVTFSKVMLSKLDADTVLVERTMLVKVPKRYSPGLDIALCDLPTRKCVPFTAPP